MLEFGVYPFGSLPQDLISKARENATREIGDHTVSLIFRRELAGSGTLIRVGEVGGILTAHHVSKRLFVDRGDSVGINIAGHIHQFFIKTEHLLHHVVGECGSDERSGPDLSFIEIRDVNALSTIEAKKSFYRLYRKPFGTFRGAPLASMMWYLAGAPSELASRTGEGTVADTVHASHFMAEGQFRSLVDRGGFDYIELNLIAGAHGFPHSFAGASGGGVWLVPLTMDPDKGPSTISYSAPLLAGVAFHQSGQENGERVITCHGPCSIEERLAEVLNRAA